MATKEEATVQPQPQPAPVIQTIMEEDGSSGLGNGLFRALSSVAEDQYGEEVGSYSLK